MVPMAGIFEEDIARHIAGKCPAHVLIDVLIAVVIDVAESDGMSLLQMAEASRSGDILKEFSLSVTKHPVRNHRREIGIAGADVKIKPAIVIEIAEVTAHPQ